MKSVRTLRGNFKTFLVVFAVVVAVLLMAIQINWIRHFISFQQRVFERSVKLALNEGIAALTGDAHLCNQVKECLALDSVRLQSQLSKAGAWKAIDEAIKAELSNYGITLPYTLRIVESDSAALSRMNKKSDTIYSQCLKKLIGSSGYLLVVKFPSRTAYFLQKVGIMFLASSVLILLFVFAFFYLLQLYRREVRIVSYTKEMLNNVSHEFKTPLSGIALAANMISKRRYVSEEKLVEYAQLIAEENRKLQALVESLLCIEAVEHNTFVFDKRSVEVKTIIEEAIFTTSLIVEQSGGVVELRMNAPSSRVYVDRLHMVGVLVNLISNAVKYCSQKPKIILEADVADVKLIIRVIDNGIGIPSKCQKLVFEKYYRVPSGDVHNVKGFGIGLAYVKSVVEAHGGTVEVKSQPTKGSTFTLTLPLLDV